MCECIKRIENEYHEFDKLLKQDKLSFVKAEFTHTALFTNPPIVRMYAQIECTVKERKYPIKKTFHFRYCPLCGEKYEPATN